ncbi:hypothetical protein BDP55DRAFT_282604 [Colletotrichum godetiae]|uniref:Uncharacterized protein n=1 Tax=Colletotrichum godetiae TaxID=1209918 RepID=A0AAJ0AGF8_9PEZI|nr:uncharacterized protein BDP55DRAFT_282604 [Colletotrichum godetiae]KAK1671983.1 hypothetical protein BDP55DRAFT_282604 [Colletotrichum godetiae]
MSIKVRVFSYWAVTVAADSDGFRLPSVPSYLRYLKSDQSTSPAEQCHQKGFDCTTVPLEAPLETTHAGLRDS